MPTDTTTTTPPADSFAYYTIQELTEAEYEMLTAVRDLMRRVGPSARLSVSAHDVPFTAFDDIPSRVAGNDTDGRWLSGAMTCGTEIFQVYSTYLVTPAAPAELPADAIDTDRL